jgi:hypothetical protein
MVVGLGSEADPPRAGGHVQDCRDDEEPGNPPQIRSGTARPFCFADSPPRALPPRVLLTVMTPAAKTSGPKIGDDVSSGPGADASGRDHHAQGAGEDTEDQHELVAFFRSEGDHRPRAVPPLMRGWPVTRRGGFHQQAPSGHQRGERGDDDRSRQRGSRGDRGLAGVERRR